MSTPGLQGEGKALEEGAEFGRPPPPIVQALLLIGVAVLGSAQILSFERTPESWSQLCLLRERTLLGALEAFPEYPYYRPLWFFWLSLADRMGLGGGAAHALPLAMHAGGVALLFSALRHAHARLAFPLAFLAAIAPGLSSALSWLAAGNKCFVFFWLALGVCFLLRVRSVAAYALALVFSVVPAIASSENGYLACLLLPFVAVTLRAGSERRAVRVLASGALALASAGLAALHLFVLSPQRATTADNRVSQLLSAWLADPIASSVAFADNMGRFFLHGVGAADDAARIGAYVLSGVALVAILMRWRSTGVALAVFVILNVPASLFPGESSRHHAYLPAIGAALIVGTMLVRVPLRAHALAFVGIFFFARGFEYQRPWADYCAHSARVYDSCVRAMPRMPTAKPVLFNVPEEYRAAFLLHLGPDCEVRTWPNMTVLTSRSQAALPEGWSAPNEKLRVLEYDGMRVRASTLGEIAARQRAPAAWWEAEIRAFERPWLAWGEILRSKERLVGNARSFRAAAKRSAASAQDLESRDLRVTSHGVLDGEAGLFWDCEIGAGESAWLILPWTPWAAMPTTENAWLFTLAPLPWAFEIQVFDASRAGRPGELLEASTHPGYGFLPGIWCDERARKLRIEIRPRR